MSPSQRRYISPRSMSNIPPIGISCTHNTINCCKNNEPVTSQDKTKINKTPPKKTEWIIYYINAPIDPRTNLTRPRSGQAAAREGGPGAEPPGKIRDFHTTFCNVTVYISRDVEDRGRDITFFMLEAGRGRGIKISVSTDDTWTYVIRPGGLGGPAPGPRKF